MDALPSLDSLCVLFEQRLECVDPCENAGDAESNGCGQTTPKCHCSLGADVGPGGSRIDALDSEYPEQENKSCYCALCQKAYMPCDSAICEVTEETVYDLRDLNASVQ